MRTNPSKCIHRTSILLVLLSVFLLSPPVHAKDNIVRAVLFFSETCQHCHDVMTYVLPPLVEKYPGQLDIVGIDVGHPLGMELYQTMLRELDVPENRQGVPALVIGSTLLLGTTEIEANLPAIIQAGAAEGGIDWPQISGLADILASQSLPISSIEQPSSSILAQEENDIPAFVQRFNQDPLANGIALVVLAGMLAAGIFGLFSYLKGPDYKTIHFPNWAVPLLAVIGLGVALYLTFVEITHTEAICGPIGNCNTVQQSSYARLFGVIPVGVTGAAGYIAIIFAWFMTKIGPINRRNLFTLLLWGMGCFGLLFSIYLTFLEPFVIGATCAWCITSAVVMTFIFLASTEMAKQAIVIETEEFEQED